MGLYSGHVTLRVAATLGMPWAYCLPACSHKPAAVTAAHNCSSCFAQGAKTASHGPPSPQACPWVTIRFFRFLSEAGFRS